MINLESIKDVKENFIHDFSKCIYEEKKDKDYFEIVFLCIGTDKLIGDSFGPLVGTKLENLLKEYNIFNVNIYGNLNENICYTNVEKWMNIIEKKHPKACIVVIDAALSKKINIGKIYVKKGTIELAKGLNKSKIMVGDIAIKAVVGKNFKLSKYNFFSLQNVSLNQVISLSEIVAEGIYEVIKFA